MTTVRRALALVAAAAGVAAGATAAGTTSEPAQLAADIAAGRDHMTALELADRIMHRDSGLRVFDLRSAREYDERHIPSAQVASVESLLKVQLRQEDTVVLYSEGGGHAAQAWVLLRLRGYRKVFVLREGLYEWIARVVEPRLADDATRSERNAFDQAKIYSRFFGGLPLAGVPRAEVPVGYWTGESSTPNAGRQAVAALRRRGC